MKKIFLKIRDKLFLVKIRDILSLIFLIVAIPYALYLKIMEKKIWLVCERREEARDNGYAFFKYVADNVRDVNVYYAIDKKSNDYKKLHNYGKKVISFGSVRHMAYYLACDVVVSSVKNCGPNDLIGFLFRKLRLMNNKIYFIQHGIIINNLDWLHYKETRFAGFTCGAYPEYEFVSEHFGYSKNRIIFTGGLCRYDYLHSVDNHSQDYILIMPTWRKWLKHDDPQLVEIEQTNIFTETNYYKNWTKLIQNEDMLNIAKKNGLKAIFYPHPTMQYYIEQFKSSNNNLIIADEKEWDIQELIRDASMLITDYSSVFFDFIYMKKPIIFYQFDKDVFRKYHYAEGYFQYDNNPFSNAVYGIRDVNEKLESIIMQGFSVDSEYLEEHKKYFPLYDTSNSARTFKEIYRRIY